MPPTPPPTTDPSQDRQRSAKLRSLGFSGALGATIGGGAAKAIHEGAAHMAPHLSKHTGKMILPAAMIGLGAGIGDKKEELHRATGNIIQRTSQAVGAARGAREERGSEMLSMRRNHIPGGLGEKMSADACHLRRVLCTADQGQTVARSLFANYGAFEEMAKSQLSSYFRTGAEASTPLRPHIDLPGYGGPGEILSGLVPR